jgi:hypothetical protein
MVAIAPVLIGVVSLYWAFGGATGLAHPEARDAGWHLLAANTGFRALAGAWSVTRRGRFAAGVTRLSSGLLFAWSLWKLPLTLLLALGADPTVVWPEDLAVAAIVFIVSVLTGLGMLRALVRRSGLRPAPGATRPSHLGPDRLDTTDRPDGPAEWGRSTE